MMLSASGRHVRDGGKRTSRKDDPMAKDLIFYTNPMSRGRIVRWMLEEVGQPYDTVILDYASSLKGADYLAINPMGKVPGLKHGDTVITEGAAICAYLADTFPEAGLAPPTTDRGDYYRWLFFAAGPVEAAVTARSLGYEPKPEQKRMAGFGDLADTLNALELAVKGRDYIAGGKFTAADVYVGSQIGWGMQFGSIDKRSAFTAYWDRISSRPAAVRAREIDDGLIAAAQAQAQPA
jgi:glutathione S-transferase